MARTSAKVGRGPCPSCGERVSFHRTAGGMLNYECFGCDQNGYAHKGGKSEAEWMASIERPATPPAPAPEPEPMTPERANRIGASFADRRNKTLLG